jgi:hypothetical protein
MGLKQVPKLGVPARRSDFIDLVLAGEQLESASAPSMNDACWNTAGEISALK